MERLRKIVLLLAVVMLVAISAEAQCSICSKTASQMGADASRGINAGILYLAAAPFAILGYIGYRWWKSNSSND
jgi:hypothetical protein